MAMLRQRLGKLLHRRVRTLATPLGQCDREANPPSPLAFPWSHPAFRALYPDRKVPPTSSWHERRQLSTDLHCWTASVEAGRCAFSEDVAVRNLPTNRWEGYQVQRVEDRVSTPVARRGPGHTVGFHPNGVLPKGPLSAFANVDPERKNDFNADWPFPRNFDNRPSPTKIAKTTPARVRLHSTGSTPILTWEERPQSLSRKPNFFNLRNASEMGHGRSSSLPVGGTHSGSRFVQCDPIKRAQQDKPLPPNFVSFQQERKVGHSDTERGSQKQYSNFAEALTQPLNVKEPASGRNKDTTTFSSTWAPAVTHETVIRNVHEIRTERLTHEIHKDHYYHRILPVIDLEILPTRHFVQVDNEYVELDEEDVPAEERPNRDCIVEEIASSFCPRAEDEPVIPEGIPRRNSGEVEDERKEYVTSEGVQCTERTWVHSPVFEPGILKDGESYEAHFRSGNSTFDALGVEQECPQDPSYAQAQQHSEEQRSQGAQSVGFIPPSIPPRRMLPLFITRPGSILGIHHDVWT